MYGKENGKKVFSIPVEWVMTETLDVRADNLKEALQFLIDNDANIPLGTDAQYIDGTWKISADESNTGIVEDFLETAECYCSEREAEEYDEPDLF